MTLVFPARTVLFRSLCFLVIPETSTQRIVRLPGGQTGLGESLEPVAKSINNSYYLATASDPCPKNWKVEPRKIDETIKRSGEMISIFSEVM